jgi:hypothetical protein
LFQSGPDSVAFVRQANIAAGPQQVINGVPLASRARESGTAPSKLAGGGNELLQHAGASSLGSGINPPLAAVGEIDRAEVCRGQG